MTDQNSGIKTQTSWSNESRVGRQNTAWDKYCMGHTYAKKLPVVYSFEIQINWASCIFHLLNLAILNGDSSEGLSWGTWKYLQGFSRPAVQFLSQILLLSFLNKQLSCRILSQSLFLENPMCINTDIQNPDILWSLEKVAQSNLGKNSGLFTTSTEA